VRPLALRAKAVQSARGMGTNPRPVSPEPRTGERTPTKGGTS
jgi:hypothetical protein